MKYPSHPSSNSVSRDFLTYGNDGIGVNRAFERRIEERSRYQADLLARGPNGSLSFRRKLGSLLIAAGTAISGAVPSSGPQVTGRGAT
ncbi:MAG: hypothetical protein WKF63_11655 [Thermomicrobiales bacterium]